MFGLGFGEIILIGLIALLVIGPEQLPGVARSIAKLLNELKRTTDEFKKEFEDENITEAMRELKQLRAENLLRGIEEEKTKALGAMNKAIDKEVSEIKDLENISSFDSEAKKADQADFEPQKELDQTSSEESLKND